MYMIKTTDKFDGTFKVYFEDTLTKAKELAAPLRRNFNIKIVKMEDLEKTEKFVIKEKFRSEYYSEEDFDEVKAILDQYPSDELVSYFATQRLVKEEENARVFEIGKNIYGEYEVRSFEDGEDTYTFIVEEESIFMNAKEEKE